MLIMCMLIPNGTMNVSPNFFTVPGVSATPYEDNMRYFNVMIAGPSDSPYEGMSYLLVFEIRSIKPIDILHFKPTPHHCRGHVPARALPTCGLSYGPTEG